MFPILPSVQLTRFEYLRKILTDRVNIDHPAAIGEFHFQGTRLIMSVTRRDPWQSGWLRGGLGSCYHVTQNPELHASAAEIHSIFVGTTGAPHALEKKKKKRT